MAAAQQGLFKTSEVDWGGGVVPLLRLLKAAAGSPQPGARILDFGCGIGNGTATLLASGYDAYGVDVHEYWGRDAELYWKRDPNPHPAKVLDRLSVATLEPYRLPYPDNTFDHVVSCEVFEHVDDRHAAFAEIERVLKPGGTSVHVFPKRWVPLFEGHINVPLSPLCKNRGWLLMAALAGFRSVRQQGMSWREVYRANIAQMKITHYASRPKILREAHAAGLDARFAEFDYVARAGTGWTELHRRLSRYGMGAFAFLAAAVKLENMLVLTKPRPSSVVELRAAA